MTERKRPYDSSIPPGMGSNPDSPFSEKKQSLETSVLAVDGLLHALWRRTSREKAVKGFVGQATVLYGDVFNLNDGVKSFVNVPVTEAQMETLEKVMGLIHRFVFVYDAKTQEGTVTLEAAWA